MVIFDCDAEEGENGLGGRGFAEYERLTGMVADEVGWAV